MFPIWEQESLSDLFASGKKTCGSAIYKSTLTQIVGGDAPAQGKRPANVLADQRKCRYLKVTEMAFPTEPNNINHLVQTTNLGVRSSNLFGRAKFPPSRTKLRTLGTPVEDGRSSNLDRSLAAKGSPCVVLPPDHRDRSGLIAVMDSAMAPPFLVVLPVKLAAGKLRSV
jgi:hypothetical protein